MSVKRCNNCVMPLLDHHELQTGLCKACSAVKPSVAVDWPAQERLLREAIEKFKGQSEYDVVHGLSGGKDSAYGFYFLTRHCNARVLAVHNDADATRDQAIRNVQNACKATGADRLHLQTFSSEEWKRMYTLLLRKNGAICAFCAAHRAVTHGVIAYQRNIPFASMSADPTQLSHLAAAESLRPFDARRFRVLLLTYEKWLRSLLEEEEPEMLEKALAQIGGALRDARRDALDSPRLPRPVRLAYFSNWWEWPESRLLDLLGRELSFEKASKTVIHTNCRFEEIRGLREALTQCYRYDNEISFLVRRHVISREEGLEQLALLGKCAPAEETIEWCCDYLGIGRKDFDAWIMRPQESRFADLLSDAQSTIE